MESIITPSNTPTRIQLPRSRAAAILNHMRACHEAKKSDPLVSGSPGGSKQNRTAVHGFADRCLTTRPWNRIASAKVCLFFFTCKYPDDFFSFPLF